MSVQRWLMFASVAIVPALSAAQGVVVDVGGRAELSAIAPMLWGRSIERVVIVFICGLSVVLGYLLFRDASKEVGEMLAKGNGYELKLSRVGPGVFFCLFGVAGLIYTISTRPEIKLHTPPQEGSRDGSSLAVVGAIDVPTGSQRDLAIARLEGLNLAIEKLISGQAANPDKSVGQAIAVLRAWREDLIGQILGREKLSKYLIAERNRASGISPDSDPTVRAIYDEVQTLRTRATKLE